MKVKMRKIYYCEHCGKHRHTKLSMEKHESRCLKNPNRKCGFCGKYGNYHDVSKLVDILKKLGLEAVRKEAENCPACILAAIVQSGINNDETQSFDYEKEAYSWWSDFNQGIEMSHERMGRNSAVLQRMPAFRN